MLASLRAYQDFLLSTFAKLANNGKISVEQYNAAKDIVSGYSASWLASDTSDIVSLSDSLYQSMQSGTLSDFDTEVKNDIVSLLAQVKTAIGNSSGYGTFAAAKEQAGEVAKQASQAAEQASQAAESVASDIKDMSIPYAVGAGLVGIVAAPILGPLFLPVVLVPASSVIVPAATATLGYSYKKVDNAIEALKAKIKGWF